MYIKPSACPKCGLTNDNVIKAGYTTPKHNYQPFPRYECKGCGYEFSSRSFRTNKHQKKPEMNNEIFKWVCSGVSLAQISRNLGISKNTTKAKIEWLAKQSQIAHQKALYDPNSEHNRVAHIQIDEMETFEASRFKPLSITIAIDADSGFIFALDVATMNAKGPSAVKARLKYGLRKDTRLKSLKLVLNTIRNCKDSVDSDTLGIEDKSISIVDEAAIITKTSPKKPMVFSCDSKKTYIPAIKKLFPDAIINQHLLNKQKRGDPKVHDPLFTINHLCARLRADVAPLARKSWTTTKSIKGLQNLLWVYLAWINKYDITNNINTTK